MFTGLIREIGRVESYANNILRIRSKHQAKLGDSIAINGVCLTVISLWSQGFDLELSDETRAIIDSSKIRGKVHIEPAMQLHDRFEGHIVQGHVDCVGKVTSIIKRQNATDFIISVESQYIAFIVPKGSIAIDGVSLTVNDVFDESFRLTIIPHTLKETLIGNFTIGSVVNIETDLFARYINHILLNRSKKSPSTKMSWEEIEHIHALY